MSLPTSYCILSQASKQAKKRNHQVEFKINKKKKKTFLLYANMFMYTCGSLHISIDILISHMDSHSFISIDCTHFYAMTFSSVGFEVLAEKKYWGGFEVKCDIWVDRQKDLNFERLFFVFCLASFNIDSYVRRVTWRNENIDLNLYMMHHHDQIVSFTCKAEWMWI